MILKEGLHPGVPESVYHGDCAPEPSLSASVAKILLEKSPRHAHYAHPRLGPGLPPKSTDRPMDIGNAVHRHILGAGRKVIVLPFKDYKSGDAQKSRAACYANDETPILEADNRKVEEMVKAAREQLAETEIAGILDDGEPEMTMVWRDGPVWCRSRIDFLPRAVRDGGHVIVPDVKTTGSSAHPDEFMSTAFNQQYDIQAAMYERGLRKVIPSIRSVRFVLIAIEQDPPYGLSVVYFDGEGAAQAEVEVDLAIKTWGECLKSGVWPGYPRRLTPISKPGWRAMASEMRRLALLDRLAKWQAPHGKEAA